MGIRGSFLQGIPASDGSGIITHIRPRQAEISAVITRADGSVEELGVISYWHRNPIRRWAWACRQWFKPNLNQGHSK